MAKVQISTHALREEGDYLNCAHSTNGQEFLPTPSARRATWTWSAPAARTTDFYPRPPRGGRPVTSMTGRAGK